ncbi:ABC transporter permease/M1 family aminopeptidase [Salisaeta longa]|uniref:ABC transporter permease/M1 family aminopeptidase n=1 Tax=Salisaeta longa TaxID=503170 RepID=UPI0003B6F7CB|nr:M1 family aminopeptidase [Salisaeta longa]
MFWRIASHEVRFRFRALSTHVYFLLFFALSFLLVNVEGGAFGDGGIGGLSPIVAANSPYAVMLYTTLFSFLGLIITAAFMGQTIYRDYASGIHPLMFTTPVRKLDLLGGRFVGALAVNLYIFASFALGLMAGEVTPWLDASEFGAFRLSAYLQPYLLFVIPNLLFTGALFFALAATTRKMLPNYIGGILLLVGHSIAATLIAGNPIENSTIAALLDPFGLITVDQVTRYWTTTEQNTRLVPLTGLLLANRLLWIGISGTIVAGVIARFRVAHLAGGGSADTTTADEEADPLTAGRVSTLISQLDLPSVQLLYNSRARLQQLVALTRRAFSEIVRDVYFYAILAGGMVFLIIGANEIGQQYGTTVQPVTRIVANELSAGFGIIMVVLIAFYAGRLVWRERDLKVQPLTDTLPVPSSLALVSKFAALVGMVVVLQAVIMAVGIGTQLVKGYTQFELGLYVSELFGIGLLSNALFCALALVVHTVVNHKYVGHLLIILYYLSLAFLPQLGLEHPLYVFGGGISIPYSDLNGYGHYLTRFAWTALHWSAVALVLALIARLLWVRGNETTLRARWEQAKRRLTRPMALRLGGASTLMLCTGAVIFYNVNVLHTYRTNDEQKALRARYERTYGLLEDTPQPRVTAVNVAIDLFPSRRDATIAGSYTLVNKTPRAIDSVHVQLPPQDDVHVEQLTFSQPATIALNDKALGFRTYVLDAPLPPNDTLQLSLRQAIRTRGFAGDVDALVANGTFLRNNVLPQIGYQPRRELSTPSEREDYGLPPKPPLPPRNDSLAQRTNAFSRYADWIDFTATVSTAADQVALAPGHRDTTWLSDGRRYARFTTRAPMLHFYTVLSARYDTVAARWTPPDTASGQAPVDITVYHHPTHTFNLDRLVAGARTALDYYTTHFGPYQNRHLRIAEFPLYHGAFAQSFLGTIPFSESMGFIMRFDEESDIDFPFYVTAHEVAHQWWGHQVAPANVAGAAMLSETLSQYSALMVMKKRYGAHQMRRFLKYELDRYLKGRRTASRGERPLVRVAGQEYIHYQKGSNVMYALQDYIGEDRVNTALRRLINKTKFNKPPYPTSRELMQELEAVTPDSLQYILDDWFRTITLYENRTTKATYTPTGNGRYRVTLNVIARKVRADSLGAETEVAMNDWIDVGVFPPDTSDVPPEPLYLRKHRLKSGAQTITVTVDDEPARAGIDPYAKLIDRAVGDNVTTVARAADD